jgi:hypothetical protein
MTDFLAVVLARAAMLLLELIAVRVAQMIFTRVSSQKVTMAA